MKESPEPAYEAIHLVSLLLVRFNLICKTCLLDVQQLYILAFLKFQGHTGPDGQRMMLRTDVTRLLKSVYGSTDNQISLWVAGLCSNGYLGALTLDKSEKRRLLPERRGRKALVMTEKAILSVEQFLTELEYLRDDIAGEEGFLIAPGMGSLGPFGEGIRFFLAMAQAAITPVDTSDSPES